jgi:two-component system OmpR family response regulator
MGIVRVLTIDDDLSVLQVVGSLMEFEGNTCVCVDTSGEGLRLASGDPEPFDLILLDVNMPGSDGWELLTEMRARGNQTPVIFLTGMQTVEDRVRGLRLGADDYILKPFESQELVARAEAVLRRRNAATRLEYGDLVVELSDRSAWRGGRAIHLSPGEFDLLRALIEAGGQEISRLELLRKVWGMKFDPGTKVVEVQIARLRKKLDPFGPPAIQTVVGRGYRLRLR